MAYTRVVKAPYVRISEDAIKLFCYLPQDEMMPVWKAYRHYVETATPRDRVNEAEKPSGLSEMGMDVYESLISPIDEGLERYWNTVDKNCRNRNRGKLPQVDHRSPQVDNIINQSSNQIVNKSAIESSVIVMAEDAGLIHSDDDRQKLSELEKEYGQSVLVEAIRKAEGYNAKTIAYLITVLKSRQPKKLNADYAGQRKWIDDTSDMDAMMEGR